MRFLNPRRRSHGDTPSAASNSLEIRILRLIVEGAASLRHFREKPVVRFEVRGLRGFLRTPRRKPLEPSTSNLRYHTLHAFTGIMGWPVLHPKALPNSGKFSTVPLIRHSPELCGSVLASTRALASRTFSHHTWAKPRKKRCSAV